jgi:hypothetical protein
MVVFTVTTTGLTELAAVVTGFASAGLEIE